MIHSQFNILSDSQTVEIGAKHRHTLKLSRAATRAEVHAALKSVAGVTSTRPAATVAAEAREALAAAGLI